MNIPSLPVSGFFNDDKTDLSPAWRQFFDLLINALNTNASNEGLVLPTQNSTNIAVIQGNQLQNLAYTLQYGTGLYNSTANSIMFAVNNGTGAPIFKTVTLT